MKNLSIFLTFILTACCLTTFGQTKVLQGKVIISEPSYEKDVDSEFFLAPGAMVFSEDTVELGTSNKDGFFEIEVPENTSKIFVSWVGYDWETIELSENCEQLEIVLIPAVIYDFVSLKRANKLNQKHREKWLPELYQQAFEQGYITSENPCR
ncbi:MAG: hypothetical protein ABJH98_06075 [Reichenbachiella sp.]|uniref:hypothetical protein n=1 Tax=Reichenbachiella sp. TaxID=2184521 RepID=UPI003297010D